MGLFEDKVLKNIANHKMIAGGEIVCVAVSGGADSTCLLTLLCKLQQRLKISVSALHINHNLRGAESDGDEQFIKNLCKQLSVPLTCHQLQFNAAGAKSIQQSAREARYNIFRQIIGQGKANLIATAHTADDRAETLLINLMRGAGADGLASIPPVRGSYIRPLIDSSKKELLTWLDNMGVQHRTDSSNLSNKYTRNSVRNELLPMMAEKYNPAILKTLAKSAELFRHTADYLSIVGQKKLLQLTTESEYGLEIDKEAAATLHQAEQLAMLRAALLQLLGSLRGISSDNLSSLLKLMQQDSGQLSFASMIAISSGKRLLLKLAEDKHMAEFCHPLNHDGYTELPELSGSMFAESASYPTSFDISNCSVFLNAGCIPADAVIRNRRHGDRFHPLGASGGKKLKDFFIDSHTPSWKRDNIALLASGKTVLWVVGMRLAEQVRLDKNCTNILKLQFKK